MLMEKRKVPNDLHNIYRFVTYVNFFKHTKQSYMLVKILKYGEKNKSKYGNNTHSFQGCYFFLSFLEWSEIKYKMETSGKLG